MDKSTKKVLVVEDENPLREAIKIKLTSAGYTVLEAANGQEGLELTQKNHPDIILLDILMPQMNGWDMLAKVREIDEYGETVPVIMLTNLSADNDQQIASIDKLQPTFFMVKTDWQLDDILERIDNILSKNN